MTKTQKFDITLWGGVAVVAVVASALIYHIYTEGTKLERIEKKRAQTVMCEVLRENDTPLQCNRCLRLKNGMVYIRTMTGYEQNVHPSRVRWKGKAREAQELMKPYRGDK